MKEQVLNTASPVHKCCRGSTHCQLHCINITSFSSTSLSLPLNFLSHYDCLLHSLSFLSVLLLYSPSLILEISLDLPFFRFSLSACPHLCSSRGPLKKMYCVHYMEMFPMVHYHRSWPCSAESSCYSQYASQTPQIVWWREDGTLSRAASSQLHCCLLHWLYCKCYTLKKGDINKDAQTQYFLSGSLIENVLFSEVFT